MSLNKTVAFIGAGNMGEALIKGLVQSAAVSSKQLRISDKRDTRRKFLAEAYTPNVFESNIDAVAGADVVVLAVKPQIFTPVIKEISSHVEKGALIVSVAAGRTG